VVLWALSPVSSTWYSEPWVPSLPRGIVSLESRLYHVVLQRFYSFPKTSGKIPGPHNLLFNGHRGLMPGDKAAGTWRWKSTPHVAPRIKQEYSFTFSCQRVTVKHHNWRQQKVNLEGTCGIGGEAPHILNCSVRLEGKRHTFLTAVLDVGHSQPTLCPEQTEWQSGWASGWFWIAGEELKFLLLLTIATGFFAVTSVTWWVRQEIKITD